MKGKQVSDDVTEAFLKSSVAVPKLFNFGSGSTFVLVFAPAPAPFLALYCHFKFKMYHKNQ